MAAYIKLHIPHHLLKKIPNSILVLTRIYNIKITQVKDIKSTLKVNRNRKIDSRPVEMVQWRQMFLLPFIDKWNWRPRHKLTQVWTPNFFYKEARDTHWNKENIFNKWCWSKWTAACSGMEIDPFLSSCTKLNFKYIKDLNINQMQWTW